MAEMAMYVAKEKGKNCYQFYSEDINITVRNELEIEAQLRQELANQNTGLWIAYQPQISASTHKILGVEALIRWTMPDGSVRSPIDFIPIAEKTGLIIDLGAWLVHQICKAKYSVKIYSAIRVW